MSAHSIAQPLSGRKIIVYPKLAAAASRAGLIAAYRVYVIAQSRTRTIGRQHFTLQELRPFGPKMSRRQWLTGLHQAVSAGSLTERDGVYGLVSRRRVMQQLGISDPGRAVELQVTADLAQFRANCYAAWHANTYDNTPSREMITEAWGVSRQTLQAWERKTGIAVRARITLAEVDPPALGDDPLVATAALCDEWENSRGGRQWLAVVGPRGGIRAGRRLETNAGEPLRDWWQVREAPTWEEDCRIMLATQHSNHYQSPLDSALSGRRHWLKQEVKPDRSTVVEDAQTGTGGYDLPAKRFADQAVADKWQSRRQNRDRGAITEQVQRDRIVGVYKPSHAATWGEM